jgi:hypothetical protein
MSMFVTRADLEKERAHCQSPAVVAKIDDHMTRARRLVENHIEAYGMVPHPDRIKEAIAEQSQESFDLGFRAAGGNCPSQPESNSKPEPRG